MDFLITFQHYRLSICQACKAFPLYDFANALSNLRIVETFLYIHCNGPSIGPTSVTV